jgi:menaquinone-specific isochorismate synthase
MTVTPFRVPLMQDPKALYECLAAFQASISTGEAIASISLALSNIDPLQALERLGHAGQAHFYWEHPTEEMAIAAMQPVVRRAIEGGDRFAQTQTFVSEVLQRTVTAGELHLPMAGPHFFCSFTFFDRPHHEPQRFPAATVFLPQWQVACVQGQGGFSCKFAPNASLQPGTAYRFRFRHLATPPAPRDAIPHAILFPANSGTCTLLNPSNSVPRGG